MRRQEDFFNKATEEIENSYAFQNDESYSESDVIDIATSLAEYGYQYAIDKMKEYLISALEHDLGYFATGDFVKGIMKFMKEL